jgi:hypothetical protein
MKAPAFQFYPGDWRKDPELRSVSLTARGLWIELMCLMHESSRPGFLQTKTGKGYTNQQLSQMVGTDIQTIEICLTEIEANGVSHREEGTGILYSKRMVEDARISKVRREAGKQGGNPKLLNQNSNQNTTPSSSSTTSTSITPSGTNTPLTPQGGNGRESKPPSQTDIDFEEDWKQFWVKVGKESARIAYGKARKRAGREDIMRGVFVLGPLILEHAKRQGITPVHPATWLNAGRWEDDPAAYDHGPPRALQRALPIDREERRKQKIDERLERDLANAC